MRKGLKSKNARPKMVNECTSVTEKITMKSNSDEINSNDNE